ncbi:MAG TPA: protein kinase, partial [Vicinamibacteria bacterium]|nr:protein kinase [Vicinamibacteria bacterium]
MLKAGDTLGPYEVVRLLGRGGIGEVYLARDPRLGREVALKVLAQELATDRNRIERFLQEARSVSALNHPNITVIYEIGGASGRDYIAFEHVEGRTLQAFLEEGGPLPIARLVDLALPLAEALDYAHGKGIVHRDLKPANIMISELGIPKILDFGLAKATKEVSGSSDAPTVSKLTEEGVVLGTLAYMSPEQALGRSMDRRTDVFSFGTVLYEMATGTPAFAGGTATEVLNAVINKEPPPLKQVRPELPEELSRVIEKAHRKDPAERYQTMSDLVADLRHMKKQSGATIPVPATKPLGSGRARWLTVGAAVALLAVAAVLYRAISPRALPPRSDSLAVLYFENLSDPADSDRLARMLGSLLTTELSRTEGLRVVSSQRLFDIAKGLGQDEEGMVSRSVATEVARRAEVGTMVLGQLTRVGERLVATAELVDMRDGRILDSPKAECRGVEEIFSLAEALGQQVRRALDRAEGASAGDLASELTSSVDAYRAYVRGEAYYNRSRFEEAIQAFREATRLDPNFALAHYRLSTA